MKRDMPPVEQRLDDLIPDIAMALANKRQPDPTMDGRGNPTPSEKKIAGRFIEWVKFALTDEWGDWCHEDMGYHADPHRGCILR